MRASKPLLFAAAAAFMAAGLAAGPAAAQVPVDEVIVEGHGMDGPNRVSRAVRFDDLDLTTLEGREVLRLRINATAVDLCRILREDPDAGSPMVPSCRQDALRSARAQMRAAIQQAHARASLAWLYGEPIG